MTDLTDAGLADVEKRLRTELPELADALIGTKSSNAVGLVDDRPGRNGPRWLQIAAAVLVVALVGGGVRWLISQNSNRDADIVTAAGNTDGEGNGVVPAPVSFGTWTPVPDAPIDPRAFAATGWTGSEVFYWAGSSIDRGFAYSDGAAYNPETAAWRTLSVPGWGHPGLISAYGDGQLLAVAKGSGVRFDPATGETTDLPPLEGMELASVVYTGSDFYALGPATGSADPEPALGIARYDQAADIWVPGPTFEGTEEQAVMIGQLSWLDTVSAFGFNDVVVVWEATSGGLVFDPAAQTWRNIPAPPGDGEPGSASHLVATNHGLVAVLEQSGLDPDDREKVGALQAMLLTGDTWQPLGAPIMVQAPSTVEVVGGGDWVVLFAGFQAPITLHVPSGAWHRQDDAPLAGVEGTNAVWADGRLVVWGGFFRATDQNPDPAQGAIWDPAAG